MQVPTTTTAPQWAYKATITDAPQEATAPSVETTTPSNTMTIKAGDTTAMVHRSPGVDITVQFPPGVEVFNWIVVLNAEQFQVCMSRALDRDVHFMWSVTPKA